MTVVNNAFPFVALLFFDSCFYIKSKVFICF